MRALPAVMSGGGASRFEARPSWQHAAVSGHQRGVPDIAYDGAESSGANIIVNGRLLKKVGGTSLATPMFVGVLARTESANNNSIGFAAPIIYSIAARTPSVFHDVTSGSNGQYSAGPGWDYVTGWGSPDISNYVNAN